MKFIKIKSFAKVNLSLNVIKKLKSGMHQIESLITFLKLHDMIFLKSINKKKHKIIFDGEFSKNIQKNNTIYKLFFLLDKNNLLNHQKFEVRVKKNIPQKSGLGGGSMNAAFLLNYLIKKKKLN